MNEQSHEDTESYQVLSVAFGQTIGDEMDILAENS